MPYFNCKVVDKSGKVTFIKYFAESIEETRALAERDGYLLLSIEEVFTASGRRKKLNIREFLTFNQELYVLIKSGQPVVRALEIILEKMTIKKGFPKVLSQIKNDVEQGLSLSEALEKFPDVFPMLYIANIKAGERGGNLAERLRDYQVYMKKVDQLRRKMVSSSVYPAIILCVIVLAVVFMFTYVIPNFSKIYLDSHVQLPLITRALLFLTEVFQKMAVFIVLAIIGGIFAFRSYSKTYKGRFNIDKIKLNIPYVSQIYKNYLISNFARTLSAILKGGIPLVVALKTVAGVTTNEFFAEELKKVIKMVEEGNSLSSSLENTGLFPPISLRLIKAGEGTGALWEMLDEVAEYYDNLVVDTLTIVSNIIEPALMIVMGVIVAIIVIAMYLPIFNLAGTVAG
ncbi:MAG: type II secretion system F family protein [Proteobacteria bacterium]|nr:type II secretion system F family protein [Pseudomonadota bacterium]